MTQIFDYILTNREWIFSGIGVLVLSAVFFLARLLFFREAPRIENGTGGDLLPHRQKPNGEKAARRSAPDHWQGISPPESKYELVTETNDSIPVGLQLFSFEYGPHGHAHPLTLKGSVVRAEIQFTCRINNPQRALFAANEYSLNVLPPRFLTRARAILEKYSLAKLRASREEVAQKIVETLSPEFEELGVILDSVTIGDISRLERRAR